MERYLVENVVFIVCEINSAFNSLGHNQCAMGSNRLAAILYLISLCGKNEKKLLT